jgi:type I restriction enzyme M protein
MATPPSSQADWAWIQLLIHYATRKAGVVIDNGALFRGGKEKNIRKKIVEEDLVEAVILLPEKLFYNTQAPGVIMIFNKRKPPERRGRILFINASQLYEKHPEVRRLNRLGEQHIQRIVEVYREFREEPGLSHVATLKEVRENDYNLNVTLYVAPPLETEEIDLERELQELLEIEKQATEARAKALQYIQQVIQANRQG